MSPLLILLIVLAIGFDFLNGVHDSSNIVATMISSRAIRPRMALTMTAIAEFCGPFIFGVAVANTIGNEIVSSEHLNMLVIIAALASAIVWNILTWLLGIPSSSSHALIGGIVGAVVVGAGFQEIQMAGVIKVLISLFISPGDWFFCGHDHRNSRLQTLVESYSQDQRSFQETTDYHFIWIGFKPRHQ